MRKTEFSFQVKIKSGPRTPLDVKVSYVEGGIKKSIHIFGKERSKSAIASLIGEALNNSLKFGHPDNINETLDAIEEIQNDCSKDQDEGNSEINN